METIILGSFILCPRLNQTVISNSCIDCEAAVKEDDQYYCNFDEIIGSEIRIVDLITILLQALEEGKTRISLPEITELFPDQEED